MQINVGIHPWRRGEGGKAAGQHGGKKKIKMVWGEEVRRHLHSQQISFPLQLQFSFLFFHQLFIKVGPFFSHSSHSVPNETRVSGRKPLIVFFFFFY